MSNNDDDYEYEEEEKYGARKQNRASAKKDVDSVVRDLHLTSSERRELHGALREDYLGYQEILDRAKSLFEKYNISYKDGEQPRW
jgi:hypothetical protein